jgi:hypothetical protein
MMVYILTRIPYKLYIVATFLRLAVNVVLMELPNQY